MMLGERSPHPPPPPPLLLFLPLLLLLLLPLLLLLRLFLTSSSSLACANISELHFLSSSLEVETLQNHHIHASR